MRAFQEQAWQKFENQVGPIAQQLRPEFDRLTTQHSSDFDEWLLANSLVYEEMIESGSYKIVKVLYDAWIAKATKSVIEVVKKGAEKLGIDSDTIGIFIKKFIKAGLDTKHEKGSKVSESAYLARDRAFIEKVNTIPKGLQLIPVYIHAFQFSGPLKKSTTAKDTYNK